MSVFRDIPESLKIGLDKNRFVQYDSGQKDKNRYIICYNTSQHYLLKGSRTWIADGTCKIAFNPLKQFYIIQCVVVNQPYTLAYIFLSGKNEALYFEAFSKLKRLLGNTSVTYIVVDFE
ncbi:hypothetical protein NGRA_2955 [Nosema granulosis]|uniref:MULE transposase domain-containing protein n=1 Tax=Nosema granulosis TaxID=83296 RepID=A0A9P6GYW6_9MICR|nr:hypothetical protein NGRA_2955 [Nosema granulosis]